MQLQLLRDIVLHKAPAVETSRLLGKAGGISGKKFNLPLTWSASRTSWQVTP
jgi:hypothetical protein